MSTKSTMVYDHSKESYKEAIGMTETETDLLFDKIKHITGSYTCGVLKTSEVTELLDLGLTEKDQLFLSTLYIQFLSKQSSALFKNKHGFNPFEKDE